jgi:ribosomal protein S18 acetylase RimI-like enzyme
LNADRDHTRNAAPLRGPRFWSWEADWIELHVSPLNERALGFYRKMGYRLAKVEGRIWRMARDL